MLTTDPTCSDFKALRGSILDLDPAPGIMIS